MQYGGYCESGDLTTNDLGLNLFDRCSLHRQLHLRASWCFGPQLEGHLDLRPLRLLGFSSTRYRYSKLRQGAAHYPYPSAWLLTRGCKQTHPDLFPFNQTFSAQLQDASDACGFTDYVTNFVTYPPKGQLPLPPGATFNQTTRDVGVKPECQLHSLVQAAATR